MKYIDTEKRVYVYWNLHKKCWSVKQDGRVKGHATKLALKDCRFLVGKKGRERVQREGKKNVHAGVSGYMQFDIPWWVGNTTCFVTYNPYKHDTFIQRTGVCDDMHPRPVTESRFAEMYVKDNKPVVMAIDFSPPTKKIGADQCETSC